MMTMLLLLAAAPAARRDGVYPSGLRSCKWRAIKGKNERRKGGTSWIPSEQSTSVSEVSIVNTLHCQSDIETQLQ